MDARTDGWTDALQPTRSHERSRSRLAVLARWTALVLILVAAAYARGAAADDDSCRAWRREHRALRAQVAGLYLAGAPQPRLDGALFDLLQREAYLTACRQILERDRVAMVGWRVVDRPPEQFASAVLESILEESGFDLSLAGLGPRGDAIAASAPSEVP